MTRNNRGLTGKIDDALPPCLISIDKEGRWFHRGTEMIRRDFIKLFYRHLEMDTGGRYIITWQGERCYVEVEDTAYIVRRVTCDNHGAPGHTRFVIFLNDDSREDLAPDTLVIGDGNVLYCRVKENNFPARFERAAYYQIASYIQEEDGKYYLPLNNRKFFIRE